MATRACLVFFAAAFRWSCARSRQPRLRRSPRRVGAPTSAARLAEVEFASGSMAAGGPAAPLVRQPGSAASDWLRKLPVRFAIDCRTWQRRRAVAGCVFDRVPDAGLQAVAPEVHGRFSRCLGRLVARGRANGFCSGCWTCGAAAPPPFVLSIHQGPLFRPGRQQRASDALITLASGAGAEASGAISAFVRTIGLRRRQIAQPRPAAR